MSGQLYTQLHELSAIPTQRKMCWCKTISVDFFEVLVSTQVGVRGKQKQLLYHTDPGLVYCKLWHLEAQAAVARRQQSLGYL